MIQIERKLPIPDVIKSIGFQKLIGKLLKEQETHDFDKHQKYISKLSKGLKHLYHYKCGYCETLINPKSNTTIDHYRPKKELKDEDSHPGYYWLGYDWNNLVPACQDCNKAKSTHFPIDKINGKRVFNPSSLRNGCITFKKTHTDEFPLLLHPEMDTPETHLTFLPEGNIKGLSKKGEVTIEICKLDRPDLVEDRRGLVNRFFEGFATPIGEYLKNEINTETLIYTIDKEFIKLKRAQEPCRPYSRLGWFLFQDFDNFFIRKFREEGLTKAACILAKAYSTFKKCGTCRKLSQPTNPSLEKRDMPIDIS